MVWTLEFWKEGGNLPCLLCNPHGYFFYLIFQQIENLEIVENYEEDSFELEDEDEEEEELVDDDELDQQELSHHQLAAKESTPSETGKSMCHV
jgi:hypothetical protein